MNAGGKQRLVVRSGRGARNPLAGSILMETLIAMVLLAVAIGPLVTAIQSAQGRLAVMRSQGESIGGRVSDEEVAEAWTWGPALAKAEWVSGPELRIRLKVKEQGDALVGLWIDGWFTAELRPDSEGWLTLERQIFAGHLGSEVIARARCCEGMWGPPWRSLVPDGSVVADRWMGAATASEDGAGAEANIVLHTPVAGEPSFEVSDESLAIKEDGAGLPSFIHVPKVGTYGIGFLGAEQEWRMEAERALDLYF